MTLSGPSGVGLVGRIKQASSGALLVDLVVDQIRRVLAVAAIVVYGPGLLFWFLVHPLARFWRKIGPAITYLIVVTALTVIGLGAFEVSGTLISSFTDTGDSTFRSTARGYCHATRKTVVASDW